MRFSDRGIWARFGFEGALIVVSILLAFSIDSWQSEREVRAEEQRILLALQAEFEANAEQLDLRLKQQHEILVATEWVLSVTGPAQNDHPKQLVQLYKNVFTAIDWYTFDPQNGVLESLLQSDTLGVIESESLRSLLAAWPAMVDDVAEDEKISRDFSLGLLTEHIAVHGPLRDIQSEGMHDLEFESGPGPSRFPSNINSLLSDPVFENLVHQKYSLTKWVIREYELFRPKIDTVLTLIRSEINK